MYRKANSVTLLGRALGIICTLALYPAQAGPRLQVLSSVKPVQLIVDAVAGDTIDSELLLPARVSPHNFALRFSDLRRIKKADVVIWLGPRFEHYLVKPLQQRASETTVSLLAGPVATDAQWQDPHIWLDPLALIASAERIAVALIEADSSNADNYRRQLATFQARLKQSHLRIAARFEALAGSGVITTHAGLQHFLRRYQLNQIGSVYTGADELLSLKHVGRLRRRVERGEARCVLLEPQYEHGKMQTLFKGLDVNLVELDVLGVNAGSYAALLSEVSDAVFRCLTGKSAGADQGSGQQSSNAK